MRLVLTSLMAALSLTAAVAALPAFAQNSPVTIYHDGLQPGWNNWSWATVVLQAPMSDGSKPISVTAKGYAALAIQTPGFNIKSYKTLTFKINGGDTGGQNLKVLAVYATKPLQAGVKITPTKGTWTDVTINISDLQIPGDTIDGFWIFNDSGDDAGTFYVNDILLQ